MTPEVVIELDRQEAISSPRSRPVTRRHRWIAAALAAVCLLALGSGSRPSPAVQLVADITIPPGGQLVALDGEILIDEPGMLTALDSRTARPRWRVQTGMERHLVRNNGDLVLVTGAAATAAGAVTQVWSLAIDMGTGDVRWRLPGLVTVVGGMVVAHVTDRSSDIRTSQLMVYSLAGQPVWWKNSVPELYTVDLKRQTVLVLNRTVGELVEYRADNGDPMGVAVLPELVGANGLHYVDGAVIAFFSDGRVASRRGSELSFANGFPLREEERTDCGSVWCADAPETFGIALLDKASGERVNGSARWEFVIRVDSGVVGIDEDFGQAVRTVSLFDPVTRQAQKLPGWTILGPRLDARMASWRGPLILMFAAPSRTWFAVIEGARMRVAGSVPYEHLAQCVATSYLVACGIGPETAKVWRV